MTSEVKVNSSIFQKIITHKQTELRIPVDEQVIEATVSFGNSDEENLKDLNRVTNSSDIVLKLSKKGKLRISSSEDGSLGYVDVESPFGVKDSDLVIIDQGYGFSAYAKNAGIRLERLQEATEVDAVRQGFGSKPCTGSCANATCAKVSALDAMKMAYQNYFTPAGDMIDEWDRNPWVWVLTLDNVNAD